jgi:hypothetical protein
MEVGIGIANGGTFIGVVRRGDNASMGTAKVSPTRGVPSRTARFTGKLARDVCARAPLRAWHHHARHNGVGRQGT